MKIHKECWVFGIYFLSVSMAFELLEESFDAIIDNPTSFLQTSVSNHMWNQHLQQQQYLPEGFDAFLENRRRLQVASQISTDRMRGDGITQLLNVAQHHTNIQDTESTDRRQTQLMTVSDASQRRKRLMKYFLDDALLRKSILSNDFGTVWKRIGYPTQNKPQDGLKQLLNVSQHRKNIQDTTTVVIDRRQTQLIAVSDASQKRRLLMQKFLKDAEARKSILINNYSKEGIRIESPTPIKPQSPAKPSVHYSTQSFPSTITTDSSFESTLAPTTPSTTLATTTTTLATTTTTLATTTTTLVIKQDKGSSKEVPTRTRNSSANLLSGLADILCSMCKRKSMEDCVKRYCNNIRYEVSLPEATIRLVQPSSKKLSS